MPLCKSPSMKVFALQKFIHPYYIVYILYCLFKDDAVFASLKMNKQTNLGLHDVGCCFINS